MVVHACVCVCFLNSHVSAALDGRPRSSTMPTTALPTGASASTSLMGAPRAQFMSARFDGKGMSKEDSPPRPGPASGPMTGPGVAAPSLGPSSAYGSQAAPLSSGRVGSVLAAGATAVASAAAAAVGSELVGEVVDGIRKTVNAFRDRGESGSTETEIVAFGSIVVDPEEQVQFLRAATHCCESRPPASAFIHPPPVANVRLGQWGALNLYVSFRVDRHGPLQLSPPCQHACPSSRLAIVPPVPPLLRTTASTSSLRC